MTRETKRSDDRELERRQREAEREWRRNGPARRETTADMGRTEHAGWGAELRTRESAAGRVEGQHYGIEYELRHPSGDKVRYDYVDLEKHRIVDRKPAVEGESVARIAARYDRQRQQHVEAYQARFGVEPSYEYSFYPAPRGIYERRR